MRKTLFITLVMVLTIASLGYCSLNNWGNTDLNLLLGREIPYDLTYTGVNKGGVSTIVSTVSKLTSTHLAFSELLLNGATKTFSMEAGEAGQMITLVKNQYDTRTLRLSFATEGGTDTAHTGFTYATFGTAAGSFITLAWVDSTVGWIIVAQYNMTIVY